MQKYDKNSYFCIYVTFRLNIKPLSTITNTNVEQITFYFLS